MHHLPWAFTPIDFRRAQTCANCNEIRCCFCPGLVEVLSEEVFRLAIPSVAGEFSPEASDVLFTRATIAVHQLTRRTVNLISLFQMQKIGESCEAPLSVRRLSDHTVAIFALW